MTSFNKLSDSLSSQRPTIFELCLASSICYTVLSMIYSIALGGEGSDHANHVFMDQIYPEIFVEKHRIIPLVCFSILVKFK